MSKVVLIERPYLNCGHLECYIKKYAHPTPLRDKKTFHRQLVLEFGCDLTRIDCPSRSCRLDNPAPAVSKISTVPFNLIGFSFGLLLLKGLPHETEVNYKWYKSTEPLDEPLVVFKAVRCVLDFYFHF